MAINVKTLKRVINVSGNEIKFDSANEDYLSFNSLVLDVFECSFSGAVGNGTYFLGSSASGSNSYIQYSSTGNYVAIKDDSGSQIFLNNCPTLIDGILKIEIIGVTATGYFNGTQFDQKTISSQLTIDQLLKRYTYQPNYISLVLNKLTLNNETFNLPESSGSITTGSEGTVATINTSHASGGGYIDSMWSNISEPLKVLNSGVKKPAFRQNGYELTFDSANSDYTIIQSEDKDFNVPVTGDWSFGGVVRMPQNYVIPSKSIQGLFGRSVYAVSTERYSAQLSNKNLNIMGYGESAYIIEILNFTDDYAGQVVSIKGSYENNDFVGYINNVEVGRVSLSPVGRPTDSSTHNYFIGVYGDAFGNASEQGTFFNGDILSFFIGDEQFNFTESRGTTTTGSEGTTATINTSHASGIQYLDSKVWNKKSFALALDSVNGDYIKTNFTETTVPVDNIDLEVSFSNLVYKGSGVQQIFNTNFAPAVNQNYLYIRVQTATTIRVSIGATSTNLTIDLSTTNTVRLTGKDLYLNNVFIQTLNTAATFITFYGSTSVGASDIGLENLDGSILSFRLQAETFNFTEGLGNEVFGSNGTIGTIQTSHASGVDRINYGMWQKNGNVLKLDSANIDSVDLDSPIVLSGDLSISLDLNSYVSANTQVLLGSDGASRISLFGGGKIYINTDTDPYYLSGSSILPATGSFVYDIERIGSTTNFYVDGSLVDTTTLVGLGDLTIDKMGTRGGNSFSGEFKRVRINTEQFLFREGQGITTESETGNTTATINTSHADGANYINNQVWNESSEKWIDYK